MTDAGYPTGYIITWKNPDVKTKDGTVANGKHVLIDGQQRITALMASIAGLEVLDEDFNKDRVKIAFNPLATDSDKRFAVQDASHLKDKKWIPDISEVFKNDFDPFEFVPGQKNLQRKMPLQLPHRKTMAVFLLRKSRMAHG